MVFGDKKKSNSTRGQENASLEDFDAVWNERKYFAEVLDQETSNRLLADDGKSISDSLIGASTVGEIMRNADGTTQPLGWAPIAGSVTTMEDATTLMTVNSQGTTPPSTRNSGPVWENNQMTPPRHYSSNIVVPSSPPVEVNLEPSDEEQTRGGMSTVSGGTFDDSLDQPGILPHYDYPMLIPNDDDYDSKYPPISPAKTPDTQFSDEYEIKFIAELDSPAKDDFKKVDKLKGNGEDEEEEYTLAVFLQGALETPFVRRLLLASLILLCLSIGCLLFALIQSAWNTANDDNGLTNQQEDSDGSSFGPWPSAPTYWIPPTQDPPTEFPATATTTQPSVAPITETPTMQTTPTDLLPTDKATVPSGPTAAPNLKPTIAPIVSSSQPSSQPSVVPTQTPTTTKPSAAPTKRDGTLIPTFTTTPTEGDTSAPTIRPTIKPTQLPSYKPTSNPSSVPSLRPSLSMVPSTSNPSESPTISPGSENIPTMINLINSRSASSSPAFGDASSPQYRAAEWVAKDPSYSSYNDDRRAQRFALATLFLALGGENWKNKDGWFEYGKSECDWYYSRGGTCDGQGRVKRIDIRGNNLRGDLPPELSLLSNRLQEIFFNNNRITGRIPESYSRLTNLIRLQLTSNDMTGPLPSFIEDMESLLVLGLGRNNFVGPIPTEIATLPQLNTIGLELNGLTGPIPTQMGNMVQMRYLALDSNDLNGVIPSELGRLTILKEFKAGENNFAGQLPDQICDLKSYELTFLRLDCAEVNCTCCDECHYD